jgi:hypothetical protein
MLDRTEGSPNGGSERLVRLGRIIELKKKTGYCSRRFILECWVAVYTIYYGMGAEYA